MFDSASSVSLMENDASATEPSFETEPLTISGAQTYRVEIPPQGSNTFSSILYIDTRDVAVNFNLPISMPSPSRYLQRSMGCSVASLPTTITSSSPPMRRHTPVLQIQYRSLPRLFPADGQISFMAEVPAGGFDTSIYFRFENLPTQITILLRYRDEGYKRRTCSLCHRHTSDRL